MELCEKYTEWISAYVDGMLDESEQAALLEHFETCPSCRALYEEYLLLTKELRDMEVEPPTTLTADVMAKIHATPKLTLRRGGNMRRFVAIAAVFAVVAFVGFQALSGVSPDGMPTEIRAGGEPAPAAAAPAPAMWQADEAEAADDEYFAFAEAQPERYVRSVVPEDESEEDNQTDSASPMGADADREIYLAMTLFERYLNRRFLGDWEELRGALEEAGYAFEMRGGFFFVEDPHSEGSYLYGMLISTLSYPGETIVILLGYHLQTETESRRVEMRPTCEGVHYYYAVPERNIGGTLGEDWEQLRAFLLYG